MNITSRLIAIHGKAGCGKSTVADYLVQKGYRVRSFAEPIRQMLKQLGVHPQYFTTRYKGTPIPEFGNKSARYLMQTLGTEWGRETVKDTIWLDAMHRSTEFQHFLAGGCLVIDDLRFDNESVWLRQFGALTLHIHRPNVGEPEGGVSGHSSERGISVDDITYHLVNDTSIQSLHSRLDACLGNFKDPAPC